MSPARASGARKRERHRSGSRSHGSAAGPPRRQRTARLTPWPARPLCSAGRAASGGERPRSKAPSARTKAGPVKSVGPTVFLVCQKECARDWTHPRLAPADYGNVRPARVQLTSGAAAGPGRLVTELSRRFGWWLMLLRGRNGGFQRQKCHRLCLCEGERLGKAGQEFAPLRKKTNQSWLTSGKGITYTRYNII